MAGAFVKPKGIDINSHNPEADVNAVFSISESFTGMDQNMSVRSIVEKYDDPLSKVSTLAISGSGYESCFVTLFSLLKSMQNLTLPFALSANKIGDAQADLEGRMTPLSSIAFICFWMIKSLTGVVL